VKLDFGHWTTTPHFQDLETIHQRNQITQQKGLRPRSGRPRRKRLNENIPGFEESLRIEYA